MSKRMIENFLEMISIASESGEEHEFICFLKNKFETDISANCIIDDYGNLICKIPQKNTLASTPLMLAAHADTVKPGKGIEPLIKDGIIYSSGTTILGADCKAGIAEIIEAILSASQYPPLEIVITKEEEIGLVGAKHLDYSQIESKHGLLLDIDIPDVIVIGTPSHMFIDITITGKGAHAGMRPEKGISAIKAASMTIAILKDGRIDTETVSNFGIIQGGSARNSVPDKCIIKGEVRSLNHKKCINLSCEYKKIFEVISSSFGTNVKVDLDLAYKATNISKEAPIVQVAKEALQSLGIKPKFVKITGGLESAIYNEKGIETIPIYKGGSGGHTVNENISIQDMNKAVKLLHYFFKKLS